MLTQAQKKNIKQLHDKIHRREQGYFVAEGEKVVCELLLSSLEVKSVYALNQWVEKNNNLLNKVETIVVSEKELQQISHLKTPNQVLAVAKTPHYEIDFLEIKKGVSLFLSNVNDPGNLGTIIRTADWFGVSHIFCSEHTADAFNSKVIQSAMGSLFRVKIYFVSTEEFLERCKRYEITILGADMNGTSVYSYSFKCPMVLVMGSESHGIDEVCKRYINEYVSIPGKHSAESLNVAIATGILCSEIMRSVLEQ